MLPMTFCATPFLVNTQYITAPFDCTPLVELAIEAPVHIAKMKKEYLAIFYLHQRQTLQDRGKAWFSRKDQGETFGMQEKIRKYFWILGKSQGNFSKSLYKPYFLYLQFFLIFHWLIVSLYLLNSFTHLLKKLM